MSRLCWSLLLWATLIPPALAKNKSDCNDLLTLTRTTLEEFSITPLNAYPGIFILPYASITSGVGDLVRERIGQRVSTVAILSANEFRDKRVLGDFETKDFALIDGLESFVTDEHHQVVVESVDLLREVLRKRARRGRPTLILVEDLRNVNRYLFKLEDSPRRGPNRG